MWLCIIFSIRAKQAAHINILEAQGLNLGLAWFLRRPERHNRRVVVLLDSRVALGGASKGRSSSGPLLRALRRTTALTLAGQLQPYYVYISSGEMPADAPSRGLLRRRREGAAAKLVRRRIQKQNGAERRLLDCAGSTGWSGFDSWSSSGGASSDGSSDRSRS